jgi:transcriptional regulator with XRE-family HTH domain
MSETRRSRELLVILRDPRTLRRLMISEGVSHRELAAAAGYRAHSKIGRLTRGESKLLDDRYALAIAHKLRVHVDVLFLPDVSRNLGHGDQKSETRV